MFSNIFSFLNFFPNNFEKTINKVNEDAALLLEKKYNLRCIGQGSSSPSKEIKFLFLSFQYYGYLSKQELKTLTLNCVHDFLDVINSNKEIRQYLCTYPFTTKNIDLDIYQYKNKNLERYYEPDIAIIEFKHEKINYYTNTPNKISLNIYGENEVEKIELIKNENKSPS